MEEYVCTIYMNSGQSYIKTLTKTKLDELIRLIMTGAANIWNTIDDDSKNIILITNKISDITWEQK